MTAAAPPLAPDIAAGLRRLKLSTIRQLEPDGSQAADWLPAEMGSWAPSQATFQVLSPSVATTSTLPPSAVT